MGSASRFTVEHLPGDVFPLEGALRAALVGRPRPASLAPLVVPARASEVPPARPVPSDFLAPTCERLEEHLAAFEPPVAVLDALRSLGRPGAEAVVTVVPPGLCGGPVEGAWRALQARRLADELAASRDTPVVPLVYLDGTASDAHRSLRWIGEHFDLVRLGLSSTGPSAALDRTPLDEERHRLGAFRERVRQLGGAVRVDAALARLAPRADETFVDAATRALLEVLGPFGIVVLRPEWLAPELARGLAATLGPLDAAPPPSALGPDLVRRIDGGRVVRLHRRAEGLVAAGEPGSRTAVELAAELVDRPDRAVPGAALIAAALARVLPLAAEVGGADRLEARRAAGPVEAALGSVPFVPHLGATVVDAAGRTALARLELGLAEALRGAGDRPPASPPPEVVAELRTLAERTRTELLARRAALRAFDPGLGQRVRRVAAEAGAAIEALCERAERLHANRSGTDRRHRRRVAAWLRPDGAPQAATLSILQAEAAHGEGLWSAAAAELDPFPSEHLALLAEAARTDDRPPKDS